MRELELPDGQDVMLEYRKIKLLYRSALKEIGTKLEILNDEFKLVHRRQSKPQACSPQP